MKIEWLNDDLTRARITRGWWRWKRVADVVRRNAWEYAATGRDCEEWIRMRLHDARQRVVQRRRRDAEWQSVASLPRAAARLGARRG